MMINNPSVVILKSFQDKSQANVTTSSLDNSQAKRGREDEDEEPQPSKKKNKLGKKPQKSSQSLAGSLTSNRSGWDSHSSQKYTKLRDK